MSCLDGLLAEVAGSVEKELKPRLSGLLGGFLRAYLPQTWEFRTEDGSRFLLVGKDGSVRLGSSAGGVVDVTVATSHDVLRDVLRTRRKDAVPAGALAVTTHTAKGKTAFDTLRSRLGL